MIRSVALLLLAPLAARADAFDNYTLPILQKVPGSACVKELTELTPDLIVQNSQVLPGLESALVVVYTNDFRWAKLLVTAARLGFYSGFHLAYVARQRRPDCQVVVLAELPDAPLERDALQAGAAILGRPLPANTLPAVVAMLVGREVSAIAASGRSAERRRGDRRQLIITGYTPERRRGDRRRTEWIPAT